MNEDDDEPRITPYTKAKSENPQHRFIEPISAYKPKVIFVPGKGMVPDPDDIATAMEYDLNEAVRESEAESKRRLSFANVGYSKLKRKG